MAYKPVMLVILDGWGLAETYEGNAIAKANKPTFDKLMEIYPHAKLLASGENVGLPEGQMGNSEVGHLNIGSGRVVFQELTRINKAIREGTINDNPVLEKAMELAAQEGKALHLAGLLSDGGVHSHINHLFSLLDLAKRKNVKKIFVHAILDGRDVLPANAKEYIVQLEDKLKTLEFGKIATVSGRYYSMDRDKRWDRTEEAYLAMTAGQGAKAHSALEAVEKAYEAKQTDEFVKPTVIVDEEGNPLGLVRSQDVMIMFNFRADRARQITRAFTDKEFLNFHRPGSYLNPYYVCLTQYDIDIMAPVAFAPQNLENTLGEYLSKKGLKQLRIAETEKYAHVTFFFNGGVERPFPGEERILVASPKVATYDLKPEMSAVKVTDKALEKLTNEDYDFIVLNYANADMVGHTGIIKAGVEAVECVDKCLCRIVEAVLKKGGAIVLTADHGNAEEMMDAKTKEPLTAHTENPVPIILITKERNDLAIRDGVLKDVAPTILDLMELEKPSEMTGESLIVQIR